MKEIGDRRLAIECGYTEGLLGITLFCGFDSEEPAHIYKKQDFHRIIL